VLGKYRHGPGGMQDLRRDVSLRGGAWSGTLHTPLQEQNPMLNPIQYEIVTGPLPPLEAADALVVTREVILNVADRHGLRATFAPRVFPNNCEDCRPPSPATNPDALQLQADVMPTSRSTPRRRAMRKASSSRAQEAGRGT
jgi:hypothetical protein